jgi:hypothetical protein
MISLIQDSPWKERRRRSIWNLEGKGLFSFEETRVCLGTQYYNTFLKKKVRKRKGSKNQAMVFYNV